MQKDAALRLLEMKPDTSFTCRKSPCFPPVKTKETKNETKRDVKFYNIKTNLSE